MPLGGGEEGGGRQHQGPTALGGGEEGGAGSIWAPRHRQEEGVRR